MKRCFKFFTISMALCLALLFSGNVAFATSTEEALEVKKNIVDMLEEFKSEIGQEEKFEIILKGKTEVTEESGYYGATLPHMTLRFDTHKFVVGQVKMNIKVRNIDDYKEWYVKTSLPPKMELFDKADKAIANMTIGSQNLSSVWRSDLKFTPIYKMLYKNIVVNILDETKGQFKVSELSGGMKLIEKENNLWSGPSRGLLKDFVFTFKDKNGTDIRFSFESLKSASIYQGLDMALLQKMSKMMRSENIEGQDPEVLKARIVTYFKEMVGTLADAKLSIAFKNIALKAKPVDKEAEGFSLDRLTIGGNLKDLRTEKAEIGAKVGFEGFKLNLESMKDLQNFIPQKGKVDVAIEKLPLQALVDITTNAMMDSESGAKAGDEIFNLLSRLKTEIILREESLDMPKFGVKTVGSIYADASSPFKVVGELILRIRNLDGVLQEYAEKNASQLSLGEKKALSGLNILQAMGQQDGSEQGQVMRKYHFQVTKEGKVLLNGSDIGVVMGLLTGIQGGSGVAPAQPVP